MRLRQVALVARDLDDVVDDLRRTLGVEVAFHDPGVETFGLRNAIMPLGDTFLEVVSPIRDDTSAGRFLERQGGDCGYMTIFQTDDLAADRVRMSELGVRIVWEIELDDIATVHLHPRDTGGAIVSLDQSVPPDSWRWAGPRWQQSVRTDVSTAIVGVEVRAAEPAVLASRWATMLDADARPAGDGHEIALDRSTVRFVPDTRGAGDGLATLVVAAGSPEARGEHEICGMRIRLE